MALALNVEAVDRGLAWLRSEVDKIEAEGPNANPRWERNRQRALRELRSAIRTSERERVALEKGSAR